MSGNEDDTPHSEGLKPELQEQLGKKLKEVYSDVIAEPVPDRFLDLLEQLEKSENKKK